MYLYVYVHCIYAYILMIDFQPLTSYSIKCGMQSNHLQFDCKHMHAIRMQCMSTFMQASACKPACV